MDWIYKICIIVGALVWTGLAIIYTLMWGCL